MRKFDRLSAVVLIGVGLHLMTMLSPRQAAGGVMLYTFEQPQFTLDSVTPLLNRAPNSGGPGFTASFTSSPGAAGFLVQLFQPNSRFVGQSLFDPISPSDTLTVVASEPIQSLTLDFAINNTLGGRLDLSSPSGNISVPAVNVGGSFVGGTLNFAPATPFTTFSLSGFNPDGLTRQLLAVDDLMMTTVPEPAAGIAVVATLACSARLRRRRPRG